MYFCQDFYRGTTGHVLATLNVKVTRGFAFGNWHYPASRAGTGKGLQGFDITQAEFASRIGVRQSYLSAVERGRGEVGAEVLLAIENLVSPWNGYAQERSSSDTGPALLIKGEATVNE